MNRFLHWLHIATLTIEVLVALALVGLAAGALGALGWALLHDAFELVPLTSAEFNVLIGHVLEVFIVVELFRIAIAYMKHENVVPTVLEAALVAIARRYVIVEPNPNIFLTAIGLASLLVAVALSWWLLAKANACDLPE